MFSWLGFQIFQGYHYFLPETHQPLLLLLTFFIHKNSLFITRKKEKKALHSHFGFLSQNVYLPVLFPTLIHTPLFSKMKVMLQFSNICYICSPTRIHDKYLIISYSDFPKLSNAHLV